MKPQELIAWVVLLTSAFFQYHGGSLSIKKVSGPVHTVILEETGTPTTETAKLYVDLRTKAPFLDENGRRLNIWDKDIKDENGIPRIPPADYDGLTPPLVLLYDDKRVLVHKEALPRPPTADAIIAIVKKVN